MKFNGLNLARRLSMIYNLRYPSISISSIAAPTLLMASTTAALQKILQTPSRLIGLVLLVVFFIEVGIMLALPILLPDNLSSQTYALVDAVALTIVCAPVLWLIIIGPLRQIAIDEQARTETVINFAGDGIITIDPKGMILSMNRAAISLFQYQAPQIIGHQITEILPGFIIQPTSANETRQMEGIRQDQSPFPVALSLAETPPDHQPNYVAIVRDLTEAQRLENERTNAAREREAMRSQQMKTLAEIATGVAHEIRNPLTSIKMLIQADRQRLEKQGMPSEDLELVEQEIRRMERSVSSLLDYARPSQPVRKVVSLRQVLDRTRTLLEGRARAARIRLNLVDTNDLLDVVADPEQLQQLFLNLILNAFDAMPDGGEIRIELTQQENDALIRIIDEGSGIAPDILDRLFTPFVTNKKQGIGLGLGISRRIAEAHKGTLTGFNVEQGACFELRLPLTADQVQTKDETCPNC
ncbi:MAG: PAS domain-containing protein [Planctomycetaceae bacterium]|nr:PAS domain-containing protein [Planctomycetaceae bacterium]